MLQLYMDITILRYNDQLAFRSTLKIHLQAGKCHMLLRVLLFRRVRALFARTRLSAMYLCTFSAASSLSAKKGRDITGSVSGRKLEDSPNTRAKGTMLSGPTVFFMA